jgi:ribosomal protein L40E
MLCRSCSAENPEDAKFCVRCGISLQRGCEKCAYQNPFDARFCAQCGTRLDSLSGVRRAEPRETGFAGERRHLTVLFCDLVNSTRIAAQLDPEEWREIVAEYHRTAAQTIERFGGHVAQYLGDGVMAYFGYPEAHDNDAERGVRAGLGMLEAVSKLNDAPNVQNCPPASESIQEPSSSALVIAMPMMFSARSPMSLRAFSRPRNQTAS